MDGGRRARVGGRRTEPAKFHQKFSAIDLAVIVRVEAVQQRSQLFRVQAATEIVAQLLGKGGGIDRFALERPQAARSAVG
jgi:hypothetical protein